MSAKKSFHLILINRTRATTQRIAIQFKLKNKQTISNIFELPPWIFGRVQNKLDQATVQNDKTQNWGRDNDFQ